MITTSSLLGEEGGGFGGLVAARSQRRAKVQVTLIERHNDHLFQTTHLNE
jgi:NADH dehydrogenase FAD-containing subunit